MLFYILCIQANSSSTVRANKMRTIKFNLTFINLIRICQTKHILKILNGAANDISIFKILKNNRKQLYRLVLVSTAEIHVIINDSPFFTSFIQQFFYFITQLRRYSIIRADHHNVIPMYFRHCHIQPQPWIIFIKKIFSIILFIQKS